MTTPQPLTGYAIARRNMTAALRAETGRVDPNAGKIVLPYPSAALSPDARIIRQPRHGSRTGN